MYIAKYQSNKLLSANRCPQCIIYSLNVLALIVKHHVMFNVYV